MTSSHPLMHAYNRATTYSVAHLSRNTILRSYIRGLRTAATRCEADSIGNCQSNFIQRGLPQLLKITGSVAVQQKRNYASRSRFFVDSVGEIVDKWIPSERYPPPTSVDNLKQYVERAKKLVTSTWGIIKIKQNCPDFVAKQFGPEAEQLYIRMNKVFASGKPQELEPLVTPNMFSNLKNQMKDRGHNKFVWTYHGASERPRIVNIGAHRAGDEKGDKQHIAQIVVRIKSKQSVAVYNPQGKLIGGNPEDIKELLEYVVLERYISKEKSVWRICGKIEPKN
ncbi:Tim44-like domain-containing protein [Paraphysoderma sedebokerense]|nr:Tim44-like domain-containing protein [Paraphysoderma sedebokerense]KAI9143572.1 Tim44-like domain-containing protein [Paraphysoderma sedebokerense]